MLHDACFASLPKRPLQALIAPELARKEPPSLQGEMRLLEASLSPEALAVGALPLLYPQQTDVAVLLSVKSPGKAAIARGRSQKQHRNICILLEQQQGKTMGEEASRHTSVSWCNKGEAKCGT